jgi:hypothetical protein
MWFSSVFTYIYKTRNNEWLLIYILYISTAYCYGNGVILCTSCNDCIWMSVLHKLVKVKLSLCLIKYHEMKTYWVSGNTAPRFLNLDTGCSISRMHFHIQIMKLRKPTGCPHLVPYKCKATVWETLIFVAIVINCTFSLNLILWQKYSKL